MNDELVKVLRLICGCIIFLVIHSSIASTELSTLESSKYEIIVPIYVKGVYDMSDRQMYNLDTATAYLIKDKHYKKSDVAFQYEVPAGTVIKILRKKEKKWYMPFESDSYYVEMIPDKARGLPIVLKLNRGLEGKDGGINLEIFRYLGSD